eukprot:scaffold27473_cov118-Isochrysis_galbana.AAC.7
MSLDWPLGCPPEAHRSRALGACTRIFRHSAQPRKNTFPVERPSSQLRLPPIEGAVGGVGPCLCPSEEGWNGEGDGKRACSGAFTGIRRTRKGGAGRTRSAGRTRKGVLWRLAVVRGAAGASVEQREDVMYAV